MTSRFRKFLSLVREIMPDIPKGFDKVPPALNESIINRLRIEMDALDHRDFLINKHYPDGTKPVVPPPSEGEPAIIKEFRNGLLKKREFKPKELVHYFPAMESQKFILAVFAFPPHAIIPLHDHPQMTVISKVLYGELNYKSFDWEKPHEVVRFSGEKKLTDLDKSIVTLPDERNLHSFVTGEKPTAVLDLVYPPYDDLYRLCTYYRARDPKLDIDRSASLGSVIPIEKYTPDTMCLLARDADIFFHNLHVRLDQIKNEEEEEEEEF